MNCFSIKKNMRYIIYGAGGNCYHIKRLFEKERYSITAILDRRAEEIHNIDDTPVYTPEQFASLEQLKDNSVIIVSVKNVFDHINIARELIALGYRNIIYKPFPILHGEHDEEWDSIDYAYEAIVEEEVLSNLIRREIACSREDHLLIFKDELMIEEGSETVMCWIPIELVCNYKREDAYKLLPMAAFYPLLNIYQYLLNSGYVYKWEEIENDFFLYSMDWVERTGKKLSVGLKNSMINSRISVFDEMQRKVDIDKRFFVRNAVSVKRVDYIRFYLTTSGRNRVSFLIAKGCRFIPVRMSREDYNCWLNQQNFEGLRQYLEKMNINRLFTSVPHPLMTSFASETTDYISLFCMPVIREIYRQLHWTTVEKINDYYKINPERYNDKKAELKILSAVKDEGCIGRLLIMYGMSCCRIYCDQKQRDIGRLIDRLFYIEEKTAVETEREVAVLQSCQILIVDSRWSYSFIKDFQGDVIFLLQWGEDNNLCDIQDGFHNKKQLFQTIWQQKKISGWMFKKLERKEENIV